MIESMSMGKYQKGDHVKFEVADDRSRESEWMWLLVDDSDDGQELSSANWTRSRSSLRT